MLDQLEIVKWYSKNLNPKVLSCILIIAQETYVIKKTTIRFFTYINILLGLTISSVYAENIAVVYPELPKPHNEIFDTILSSIKNHKKYNLITLSLPKTYDLNKVKEWIDSNQATAIIVLGSRGAKVIYQLKIKIPIVYALIPSPLPRNTKNIVLSYAPAPEKFFAKLKELNPNIQNIHIVYNPVQNEWLIKYAKEQAKLLNYKLTTYQAADIRKSASFYENILDQINPETESIWLPMDKRTLNNQILNIIIKKSWDRQITIFSSSLAHADRGTLFALYPDYARLGIRLFQIAVQLGDNTYSGSRVLTLEDVKVAANMNVARHLGLNINCHIERDFDYVFNSRGGCQTD